jgi:serine acetyltransferase
VILYRLSSLLQRRGRRVLGRLAWQLNIVCHKVDIPPHTSIGAGFVILNPSGVVIAGQLGRHITVSANVGVGAHGRRDVGAGPGIPMVEDGVWFEPRSGVLSGIRIPSGARIPAHLVVAHPRQLDRLASKKPV